MKICDTLMITKKFVMIHELWITANSLYLLSNFIFAMLASHLTRLSNIFVFYATQFYSYANNFNRLILPVHFGCTNRQRNLPGIACWYLNMVEHGHFLWKFNFAVIFRVRTYRFVYRQVPLNEIHHAEKCFYVRDHAIPT